MKKSILYLCAFLCVTCLFTSCNKDDDGPDNYAKTYGLAEYKLQKIIMNDAEAEVVVQGAAYVNYICVYEGTDYGTPYGAMFRGIFGVLLPQVLQTVTLETDRNITAQYTATPNISFEPAWVFTPPTSDIVKGLIPTTGWVKSPKNLATWSEKNGKIVVKLNIAKILEQNGIDDPELLNTINTILKSNPATIRTLLEALAGVEVNISDETINMLLSWVNNGIPLTTKEVDGHTYMYLDKQDFDPLMKMRENEMSDIMILWDVLCKAGIIPQEAQLAALFINAISGTWTNAEAFDLGLDLQLLDL